MFIGIEEAVLEKFCREIIETILFCLPNAFKGTIYRIRKPPELIAERITSGIIDKQTMMISWGLPAESEYNPPGKPWIAYMDRPGAPLEAMACCVEKQKSWTTEDPGRDSRSVRLQVQGIEEGFHHMEPVLIHKSDLNLEMYSPMVFPRDCHGNAIWRDSDYIVVAVIKIHFHPHTIKMDSHETRVIKKLSRSLGTELLSYKLQQDSVKALQQLTRDRLNACNILADSLRNAITKSGMLFALVKQVIGLLRDQWEQELLQNRHEKDMKMDSIRDLNEIIKTIPDEHDQIKRDLIDTQKQFLELSLPPEKGENWLMRRIEEKWRALLEITPPDDQRQHQVWQTIDRLKKSLYLGQDPGIIAAYDRMPEPLTWEWVNLLYNKIDRFDASYLERLIQILDNPSLTTPYRLRSRKALMQLKALAENMNQLEKNTNFLLHEVLNGGDNGWNKKAMDELPVDHEN